MCFYVLMKFASLKSLWNLNLFMYFQIIIIIMAKTSRTGRTLKETDRWGYDPATHVTNIAKTLKCKVINNEFDHFKFVLINNYFIYRIKRKRPSMTGKGTRAASLRSQSSTSPGLGEAKLPRKKFAISMYFGNYLLLINWIPPPILLILACSFAAPSKPYFSLSW